MHSSLDMGMFLRRSHFFIIIEKKINKTLYKLCLRQFNIGLNQRTNSKVGLKQGLDRSVRSSKGFQIFDQVTNRVGKIADFGHK